MVLLFTPLDNIFIIELEPGFLNKLFCISLGGFFVSKIFVTGITGLLGSAFSAMLLERSDDIQIIALARGSDFCSAKDRVSQIMREQCAFDGKPELADSIIKRIKTIDGEILSVDEKSLFKKLKGVDVFFHCAADVNFGKDIEGKTLKTNYEGTRKMLALANKLMVKSFHYVSTAYVAGKHKGIVPEDGLVAKDFNNSYEKSKFMAEQLVRSSGMPFTIYRPSIVVGRASDGKIRKPLAFYRVLEFMAKLKKHRCSKMKISPFKTVALNLRMKAVPSDKIYFVPIDYVQKCIVELFLNVPPCNKTYHLTGNSPVSTAMIGVAISRALGIKGVAVEAEVENPTQDEKIVQKFLVDFLPYFSSQGVFDVKNTKKALGCPSVDWVMDTGNLERIIHGFYLDRYPELFHGR
jgi:nucleoside-diphosphate-sugar epimerase